MNTKKSSVTIADVAEKAGVSKTTVSRYLNGQFEFMSENSQKKIQAAIDDLNYRPNHLARSLRLNKSRLIGVIVADISSPFSSILVKGISDHCKKYGYNVLIANTDNDTYKEQEYILSMIDQRVEGLIVNTTGSNDEFLLQLLHKNIPIILADRPIFPIAFDTVKTNDDQSTIDTVMYLAAEGFKKVGYFTEPIKNIGTRIIRKQAYQQACIDKLDIIPQVYEIDVADLQNVENYIRDFIEGAADEPRVIFAANGVVMLTVLRAINKLNLQIPQDVGICGFDDWPWAALIGPGITAISQPSYEVGTECVKQIMSRLQRNKKAEPQVIKLPTKLIIRGSTRLR